MGLLLQSRQEYCALVTAKDGEVPPTQGDGQTFDWQLTPPEEPTPGPRVTTAEYSNSG